MEFLPPDAEQSTEIVIPGIAVTGQTGQKWYFPNIQNLLPNMAFIMSLSTFFKDSTPYGPVSGTATASQVIMESASIYLYGSIPNPLEVNMMNRKIGSMLVNGNFLLQGTPLCKLNNIETLATAATSPFYRYPAKFPYWLVDWTKSYIQLAVAPANTTDIVVPFNIAYCFRQGYLAQN